MKQFFSARPWWANALLAFCSYMAIIYLPFDLFFKPVSDDQEVWFESYFQLVAKWLAIPIGLSMPGEPMAFYMKKWMWPWAGVYVLQVAFSMMVWQLSDDRGAGLFQGLVTLGIFSVLAVLLLRRPTAFNQQT